MQLTQDTYQPNAVLRVLAIVFSYLFHPLFIPTYFFLYLIYRFPYEFSGIGDWQLQLRLFSTFWMTAFFPAFAVFLLYRLKLISNIYLRTQKERIIPFFIAMFFYWWMYYLSRNMSDQPIVLKFFYMGIFICMAIGVVVNNYMKISMHGMGMGGLLTAMLLISFYYQAFNGWSLAVCTIATGIVGTSRLLLNHHTSKELYAGLGLGAACQLIGYLSVM